MEFESARFLAQRNSRTRLQLRLCCDGLDGFGVLDDGRTSPAGLGCALFASAFIAVGLLLAGAASFMSVGGCRPRAALSRFDRDLVSRGFLGRGNMYLVRAAQPKRRGP